MAKGQQRSNREKKKPKADKSKKAPPVSATALSQPKAKPGAAGKFGKK